MNKTDCDNQSDTEEAMENEDVAIDPAEDEKNDKGELGVFFFIFA